MASAQSSWAAARAERLPSLTLGADYYALNQQPELQVTLPGLPMVVQQSFINQNSGGAHGIVTQPLYTSGRISSGIAAAQSQVSANCDDLRRTVLDVKMNVAEYYVVVLSATKFVQVAQSKVLSLTAHLRDVSSLYEKGLVSKNDLLAAEVALADARQKALDTANKLEVAQADENLRVARDRYQHQVGTNTEVLDAETLRIQAYTNLYDSTYQAVLAGLRLWRAVGTL